jgi:hypothetical protein
MILYGDVYKYIKISQSEKNETQPYGAGSALWYLSTEGVLSYATYTCLRANNFWD